VADSTDIQPRTALSILESETFRPKPSSCNLGLSAFTCKSRPGLVPVRRLSSRASVPL